MTIWDFSQETISPEGALSRAPINILITTLYFAISYCALFFVFVICFLHKAKIINKVRQKEKKTNKQKQTKNWDSGCHDDHGKYLKMMFRSFL